MKVVSEAFAAKLNTKLGTEPIPILKIEWWSGHTYYASKPGVTFLGHACEPLLQSLQKVSYSKQENVTSIFGVCGVTLNDDGSVKQKFNRNVFESTRAKVYLYYEDNGSYTMLLSGKMLGGATWSEGDRKLECSIESIDVHEVAGYQLKSMDSEIFEYTNPTAVGKAWPMVFGTVVNSPTLQIRNSVIGKVVSELYSNGALDSVTVIALELMHEDTVATIAETLDETGTIYFSIMNILCSGKFNSSTMLITDVQFNLPWINEPITIAARSGEDSSNPLYMWVPEGTNIENKFVYIEDAVGNGYVNYCIQQIDGKAKFIQPWFKKYGILADPYHPTVISTPLLEKNIISVLPDSTFTITYTYGMLSPSINTKFYKYNDDAAGSPGNGWDFGITDSYKSYKFFYASLEHDPELSKITVPVGTPIVLLKDKEPIKDIYICNLFPSSEIISVQGRRTATNGETKKERKQPWEIIPSRYYTVNLSEEYVDGYASCGIEFDIPLMARVGEEWEKDILVTHTSTVGPNVIRIVNHLITEFTDFGINNSTNHTVTGEAVNDCEPYPANFAIFELRNVLELCKDICFQARCSFAIDNDEVTCKYLSKVPGLGTWTVGESEIAFKSLNLGFTGIGELATLTRWKWSDKVSTKEHKSRKSSFGAEEEKYKERNSKDDPEADDSQRVFIYTKNADIYGTIEKDFDIYIYSDERNVKKTALFWGYRLANIWRTASFDTFFNNLQLEVFDRARILTDQLSSLAIVGEIRSIELQLDKPLVGVTAVLGSKSGDATMSGEPQRDESFWLGDKEEGNITWWYLYGANITRVYEPSRVDPSDTFKPDRDFDLAKQTHDTIAATKYVEGITSKYILDMLVWKDVNTPFSPLARAFFHNKVKGYHYGGSSLAELKAQFKNDPQIMAQLRNLEYP